MPEVFAQGYDLQADSTVSAVEQISRSIRAWVGARWPSGSAWFSATEQGGLKTPDGSIFRWEPFQDRGRVLLDFTWRHAHVASPSISWSTRVTYAVLPGRTYASIRVANTGPALGQAGCLMTTRPRLLLHLCDHSSLRADDTLYSPTPQLIAEDEFPSFVRYELFDPSRRYPVALLSPDREGRYLLAPDMFGREFVGLARTYVATDPRSTFALTDEIGSRQLSCFHGAMRIYLPGLTRESDPTRHPLIVPRRLTSPTERMGIAQALAVLTTRRFDEAPFVAELRDERAVSLEEKRSRLVAALERTKREAMDADDFRQMAELYSEENEALTSEIELLRERLEESEHRAAALQYALGQKTGGDAGTESGLNDLSIDPTSVFDAVEQAQSLFADQLLVLPSALDSAADSPYERAGEVLSTLQSVAELVRTMQAHPLGKPLRDAFSERGIDYRVGISKGTPKKLRKQYRFVFGSREYVCEEHICLGGGTYDPAHCLRIYLSSDGGEDGKFVIGHVGRHLDVATTT